MTHLAITLLCGYRVSVFHMWDLDAMPFLRTLFIEPKGRLGLGRTSTMIYGRIKLGRCYTEHHAFWV